MSGPCFLHVSSSSRQPPCREASPLGRPDRPAAVGLASALKGFGLVLSHCCHSPTVIPDALQHEVMLRRAGIHAPLDPRHKAEGDIEENLHNPTASLPPPWQGKQRDQRCASPRTGADTDVSAKTKQCVSRRPHGRAGGKQRLQPVNGSRGEEKRSFDRDQTMSRRHLRKPNNA